MKLIVHVSKFENVTFQNVQLVAHQRSLRVANCLLPKPIITTTLLLRLVSHRSLADTSLAADDRLMV